MSLTDFLTPAVSPWTLGSGKDHDVVLSSRIRLARNFKAQPFPARQNQESALQVWKVMSDFCQKYDWYRFFDLSRTTSLERQVLVEKHLISPAHAQEDNHYRALVLSQDGHASVMINEEDHLRLQVFAPGLDLENLWLQANQLDDRIGQESAYAFDRQLGYLTSCPTNLGTGLRASILVHVPGLRLAKKLVVFQELTQMGMTVRGLFGEGSESIGDFYQLSNQQTLGRSEEEIINNLLTAATRIINEERRCRQKLIETMGLTLEDQIWRHLGILASARQLTSKEAYHRLSLIRMGAAADLLEQLTIPMVDVLYLQAQPGYMMLSTESDLSEQERDCCRASWFRQSLAPILIEKRSE